MPPKEISLDKILKQNPHIRREELEENSSLNEELRQAGIHRRGYQLAPPFARRRVLAGEPEKPDPRTINLKAARH